MTTTKEEFIYDGILYSCNTSTKEATIVKQTNLSAKKIVIPDYITYNEEVYTVMYIGAFAFADMQMYEVEMPDTICNLGRYCFANCDSLMKIRMSNNLRAINSSCFVGCKRLANISLPVCIGNLGAGFLSLCNNLRSITCDWNGMYNLCIDKDAAVGLDTNNIVLYIPKGTTELYRIHPFWHSFKHIFERTDEDINPATFVNGIRIGSENSEATIYAANIKYLLHENRAIVAEQDRCLTADIVIPSAINYNGKEYTVTDVADNAFYNSRITSVSLPPTINNIGRMAFAGSKMLRKVGMPDGLNKISDFCFYECSSLGEINLCDSIKIIGIGAFMGCSSIKNIHLPQNLTNIYGQCFKDCIGLENIVIPPTVRSAYGVSAFQNCKSLKAVTLSPVKGIFNETFKGCESLTEIIIPEGCMYLFNECFAGCTNLRQLYLPTSMIKIHSKCFKDCIRLNNIQGVNKNIKICHDSFEGCDQVSIGNFSIEGEQEDSPF